VSAYASALAAVGLHPDNPDGMYANLAHYLRDPAGYKKSQPHWRGATDAKKWWKDSAGIAALQWPFHSGLWYDNVPKTDAQIRAVFQIPPGTPTAVALSKLYGFPLGLRYRIDASRWSDDGGLLGSIASAVSSAYNAIPMPVKAVLAPQTLVTEFAYQHPESIPLFGKQAAQAKALFEGLKSGNVNPSDAANIAAQALSSEVHLPPDVASTVTAAAHMAAAASPLASQALQIAQASGQALASPAVPHALTLKLAPPPPAPKAVHLTLAHEAAQGLPPPIVQVDLPHWPEEPAANWGVNGRPLAPAPAAAMHVMLPARRRRP